MNILNTFAERLGELVEEDNTGYGHIASSVGINVHYLYAYTSDINTAMPTVANLIKLADYFGCSLEYMIGLSDSNSSGSFHRELPDFASRFRQIVAEQGYTLYRLGVETNTSTTTYYRWLNNRSYPNIDSLLKVTNTIDVTLDYLIGREH